MKILCDIRKILYVATIVLLFPNFVFAATINELESRIRQLESQRKELEEKGKVYGEELKKRQQEVAGLNREISTLGTQINRLKNDIAKTQNKIEETQLTVEKLSEEIDATGKTIIKKKAELAEILATLQKELDEQPLIKILKTASFSEFIHEINYLNMLNARLFDSVTELKELKTGFEEGKTQMEEKEEELQDLNQKQKVKKKALGEEKEYQSTLLQKTKGEEKKYKALLSEVEQKRAEFLREIKKLELEALREKNFLAYSEGKIPLSGTKLFVWPQDNPRVTQEYGMTSFAKRGAYGGSPHNGVDMSSGRGSEIKAIGDGKVLAAGRNRGWGNWIAIQHPIGLVSLYGHMIQPTQRSVDEAVKIGDVIGYEGSTGFSTGSHLHLSLYYEFFTYTNSKGELYFNYFDGTLNPLDYL